jgi:hypothetical protein
MLGVLFCAAANAPMLALLLLLLLPGLGTRQRVLRSPQPRWQRLQWLCRSLTQPFRWAGLHCCFEMVGSQCHALHIWQRCMRRLQWLCRSLSQPYR